MATVWFVPPNTVANELSEGDLVLTPAAPSGRYAVGQVRGSLQWSTTVTDGDLPAPLPAGTAGSAQPRRLDDEALRAALSALVQKG